MEHSKQNRKKIERDFNNMKIGILTYHRSHNYGALLQAIALRKVLVNAGHQVTYIDYWPSYHKHMYQLFSFALLRHKNFRGKIKYLRECILYHKNRKSRIINFNNFISENIEPYISSVNDNYDLIVHGSDQIWRKQPEIKTYNKVYFGKHEMKTKRKISYAASMGIITSDKADKSLLKDYILSLDAISVREGELKDLLLGMGMNDVHHDLDPTLLLPADFWINDFNLQKKYTQPYALYYKIQDSFDIGKIKKYIEARGLKLKIVYSKVLGKNSSENVYNINPRDFLELIYNAEMVFSSSFHGLAFSLIFHKQFYTSFTKNSSRAASLLSLINYDDRMIAPKADIPDNRKNVDFDKVDKILSQMRKESMNYLLYKAQNISHKEGCLKKGASKPGYQN